MSKRKRKTRAKKRYFRRNPPLTRSHTWTWTLTDNSHYQNNPQPLGSTTPCGGFSDTTAVSQLVGTDSVTYGENIKNWKTAIYKHVNATTSLVGLKYYAKFTSGIAVSDGTAWRCQHSLNTGPFTAKLLSFLEPGSGIDATANNSAKSRLLGSYISTQNTWRGGNFMAEVRETIHALAHPLKSFYNSTYDFAGKVKRLGRVYVKRRDFAKHLADAWLAYAFGVKPLISDVDDAAKALSKLQSSFGFGSHALKGHAHRTTIFSDAMVNVQPKSYLGDKFDSRVLKKIDYDVRYKGAVVAELEDSSTAIREFGLSLDDIVPAVWEAIPWSFFIDYFTNTGEMLDSMRLSKMRVAWLQQTVRNSGVVQVSPPVRRAHDTPTVSDVSCGAAWSLQVRVNRSPLGSIPYPDWHFKTPDFPSLKWLNIAALARQITASKPVNSGKGVGYHLY